MVTVHNLQCLTTFTLPHKLISSGGSVIVPCRATDAKKTVWMYVLPCKQGVLHPMQNCLLATPPPDPRVDRLALKRWVCIIIFPAGSAHASEQRQRTNVRPESLPCAECFHSHTHTLFPSSLLVMMGLLNQSLSPPFYACWDVQRWAPHK